MSHDERTDDDTQDLAVDQAVASYLDARRVDCTNETVRAHKYRLNHLIRWCEEEGIKTVGELTGHDLHRYKLWRREDGDLNNVTMVTQLSTVRVFIRWCEQIGAVEKGLSESVILPQLTKGEDQRDAKLDAEDAQRLIEYLRQFEFGSRTHALIEVLWHTGIRIGAVHSLDLDDYKREDKLLELRHRPDEGTRLKNAGRRTLRCNQR